MYVCMAGQTGATKYPNTNAICAKECPHQVSLQAIDMCHTLYTQAPSFHSGFWKIVWIADY